MLSATEINKTPPLATEERKRLRQQNSNPEPPPHAAVKQPTASAEARPVAKPIPAMRDQTIDELDKNGRDLPIVGCSAGTCNGICMDLRFFGVMSSFSYLLFPPHPHPHPPHHHHQARGSHLPLPHVGSHLLLLKVEVGARLTLG